MPLNSSTQRAVNAIGIVMAIAIVLLGPGSFLMALGSGLTSTEEDPVPKISMVMWAISGFSFLPILLAYVVLRSTGKRMMAVLVSALILIAGVASILGILSHNHWDWSRLSDATPTAWLIMAGPLLLGAIALGMALRISEQSPRP